MSLTLFVISGEKVFESFPQRLGHAAQGGEAENFQGAVIRKAEGVEFANFWLRDARLQAMPLEQRFQRSRW